MKSLGAATSRLILKYPHKVSWVCQGCAMCCRDSEDHERRIMLLEPEAEDIAGFTGFRLDEFSVSMKGLEPYIRVMRKKDKSCWFLRNRRCSIYSIRPLTCRFYPFSLNSDGNVAVFKVTDEPCLGLRLGRPLNKSFFDQLLSLASKRLLRCVSV